MTHKQMNYCINCGEQINGAKFCPICGTKQDVESCKADTTTVNVDSNVANEKSALQSDVSIQKAQTELEAKDFDSLLRTAKEIQSNFPENFYGWYFEALCIIQSPIDGTLGKLAKGLTIFSNALVAATVKSDKQREATEVKGAGSQALGVLAMETFQARIFKAIKCISDKEDAREKQETLAFGLLSDLMDKVWKMYTHKSYVRFFGGEPSNLIREYEIKLNSFIINLYNVVIESPSANSIVYKKLMGNMYEHYTRVVGSFLYKITLWNTPTRNQVRAILEQYQDDACMHKHDASGTAKKTIFKNRTILKVICILLIISLVISSFITLGNAIFRITSYPGY